MARKSSPMSFDGFMAPPCKEDRLPYWVDNNQGEGHRGPQDIEAFLPLTSCPLFVVWLQDKKGGIYAMRKAIFVFVFIFILGLAGTTYSNPFEEGVAAHERGDYSEALRLWRPLAERGDAYAQFDLGGMYFLGEGVPQDDAIALRLMQKAAEQGHPGAQNIIGNLYETGREVIKNTSEAVNWFRKSAKQGFSDAQFNLGRMYHFGLGVPQDSKEAALWYRKAAEQGHSNAQFNLGNMYHYGEGVKKNPAEALRFWHKAAEKNNAHAQINLGTSYEFGEGVAINASTAAEWYYKAGMSFLEEGQIEEAWDAYDRIKSASSGHPLSQELGKALYPYTR